MTEIVILFGLARRTARKSRKYHYFTWVAGLTGPHHFTCASESQRGGEPMRGGWWWRQGLRSECSPSCWQPVPRPTSDASSSTVQRRAPACRQIFSACPNPPVAASACGGSMTPAPRSTPPATVPPKHWFLPQPPRPLSAEMVMFFRYCVWHASAQNQESVPGSYTRRRLAECHPLTIAQQC